MKFNIIMTSNRRFKTTSSNHMFSLTKHLPDNKMPEVGVILPGFIFLPTCDIVCEDKLYFVWEGCATMNRIIALVAAILLMASIMVACTKDSGEKYVSAEGVEYSHCMELSGTMPNAAKPSTWVVYTNDPDLTFEKASKSIYSSDSNDYVDMYIVSME